MHFINRYNPLVKIFVIVSFMILTKVGLSQTDTEFWFSIPETNRYHNVPNPTCPATGTDGKNVWFKFTSMDLASKVEIYYARTMTLIDSFTMNKNSFKAVNVGTWVNDGATSIENRLLYSVSDAQSINRSDKGIYIKATTPVTVYYEISLPYNKDLLSLKGKNGLGKTFYVPFQNGFSTTTGYACAQRPYSSFDIVATENNTKIRITPPFQVFVWGGAPKAAASFDITLNKGQTAIIPPYDATSASNYKTSTTNKLSGTLVQVISGGNIAIITRDDLVKSSSSVDYVADQIVSIDRIGTDYAVVKGYLNTNDYAYVVATVNSTKIYVDNVLKTTLNAGKTYQVSLPNNVTMITSSKKDVDGETANKPIYVYHLSGYGAQFGGALIPSISTCTGSSQVAFNRSTDVYDGINFDFNINLLVRNDAIGHFQLFEDGIDVTSTKGVALDLNNLTGTTYTPLPDYPNFNDDVNWSYARLNANILDKGKSYLIKDTMDVFHLGILNGASNADAFYGYFSDFNTFNPSTYVVGTGTDGTCVCYGSNVQLYATGGTRYLWTPTDFLDKPRTSTPKAYNVKYSVPYKVTIGGACGFSDFRTIDLFVGNAIPLFTTDKQSNCATKVVPSNPLEQPKARFTLTSYSVGDSCRKWYYQTWNKVTHTLTPLVQFDAGYNSTAHLAKTVDYDFPNTTSDTIVYHITLEVSDRKNFCNKSVKNKIVVYPFIYVDPKIDYGLNTNHCQPLTAKFTSNPLGASATASYSWDFDDLGSSSAQDPTHIYSNLSSIAVNPIAKVTLTDQWNYCKSSGSVNVNIAPYIKASFVVNQINGCSPFSINITNDSKGGITNYTWYLDGVLKYSGASDAPPSSLLFPFQFTNTKTDNTKKDYIIKLVVQNGNGCIDSTKRTITVFPKPFANISSSILSDANCSPLNVQFNATGEVNTDVRHWYVGTNAIGDAASKIYAFENYTGSSFTRSVTYVSSNTWGCTFTPAPITVTVQPYIEAIIVADKEEGCPDPITGNFRVNLTNVSMLATGGSFQWNIDGVDRPLNTVIPFVDFQNPTAAPITKVIKLTVKNAVGCVSTDIVNIKVNPQVTANFTASVGGVPITPASVLCSPVTVAFDGTYTNATTYNWQFGDLGAATTQDPTFILYNDGAVAKPVTVTVTATNPSGCFATATKTYTVQPEITAEFSLSNAAGCVPLTVEVHAPVNPAATYSWTFNGNPYSGDSPILPGITANKTGGNQTYPITLTAALGICTASSSKNVTVYPEVQAKWDIATPFPSQCTPASLTLINQSNYYNATPVTSILWENLTSGGVLVGSSSTNTFNPQFVNDDYQNLKTFKVRLTATSTDGCSSVKEEPINIKSPVVAAFDVEILDACNPMTVRFTDKSLVKTGTIPVWDFAGAIPVVSPVGTYTCVYNAPGIKTVSLTYTNAGCDSTKTYSFNVPDQVVAAIGAVTPNRVCAPADVTFTNLSTGGANSFLWDFGDGANRIKSDNGSVTHRYENRNTALETNYVKLTATNALGCTSTTTALGLPIYVYPEVDAIQNFTVDNVCAPIKQTEVSLANNSLNGTVFTWTFTPDNAGGTAQTITPASSGYPKVVLANTNDDANVTYTVGFNARTVWNPGLATEITCQDNAIGDPIIVAPKLIPSFTVAAPQAVCSGGEITFANNSTRGGDMTLVWNFGDGESASSSKGANVKHKYNNFTLSDLTPTAIVTATQTSTGCTNTWSQAVRVHPYVKADFAFDIHDYCVYPLKVDFKNASSGSSAPSGVTTNFTWDYGYSWGAPLTPQAENRTDTTHHSYSFYNGTLNNDALYTIRLTNSQIHTISGLTCNHDTTRTITVIPELIPGISIPADAEYGCSDYLLTFNNISTGGTMNFVWDFANGNSAATNSVTQTVKQTFEYRGSDPNLPVPSHYPVKLTATNSKGCVKETVKDIYVYPKVEASFTMAYDDVCTPFDVTFTNNSLNGKDFHWDYGYSFGGVNQEFNSSRPLLTHSYIFKNETNDDIKSYIITLHAKTDYVTGHTCQSTVTRSIIVDPIVKTQIVPDLAVSCSDHTVVFDNQSTGGILNFSWIFDDGQSAISANRDDVTHTFVNRGPVDSVRHVLVTAKNSNGCTNSQMIPITTHPKVEAGFTFANLSNCTPFNLNITNNGLNGNEFRWDFGHMGKTLTTFNKNAFIQEFDNLLPNTVSTYTIKLVSLDNVTGCTDTKEHTIDVYPRVESKFIVSPLSSCNPIQIKFTNNSTGIVSGGYLWELDNGLTFNQVTPLDLTIDNPSNEFEKIINIKLTATNDIGCKSDSTLTVAIAPKVISSFSSNVFEGCDPVTASFNNLTPSNAYNYSWTIDGVEKSTSKDYSDVLFRNNSKNPSPIIINYNVQLKSSYKNNNTCFSTANHIVTVNPNIYPDFEFTNKEACHPLITGIINKTLAFNSSNNYLWDLGDGTSSILKEFSGLKYKNSSAVNDLTYSIKLTATSVHGCTHDTTLKLTIHPNPIASFIMDNESLSCSPFDVKLNNESVGQGTLDYAFDLDDGPIITTSVKDPIYHTYHNLTSAVKPYDITLTASTANGCTNSTSQTIYAYPEVTAKFSLNPGNAACSPFVVGFDNTTTNGYFYQWRFDDGSNSNLMSPNHRFVNIAENDQTFNVRLRSISAYDCEDDTIIPVTVYATPVANFSVNPPLKIYPDATFNFHNQSSPAADGWIYSWDFGDNYTSSLKEAGNHTYTEWAPKSSDHIYTATLKVDAPHCSSFTSNTLRLLPTVPIPFFNADIYKSCSPLEVHFVNQSEYGGPAYGGKFIWDFGDGTTSTEGEPIHIFTKPGYYNVKLTVTGDGGISYYFKTFRVFENPVANFAVYPNHVMLPDAEVHIYNLSKYAHRYEWDLGDGTLLTDKDPIHKYAELGEYKITLRAYAHDTLGGCQDFTSLFPAVWVEGQGLIKFPDAFIPSKTGSNGGVYDEIDYKNEVFHPIHYGVVEYKLMVFNRWGEQIFQSNDIKIGWDGYFNSKLCDQGVYIWRAIGKYTNGKAFDRKGNVTLLR